MGSRFMFDRCSRLCSSTRGTCVDSSLSLGQKSFGWLTPAVPSTVSSNHHHIPLPRSVLFFPLTLCPTEITPETLGQFRPSSRSHLSLRLSSSSDRKEWPPASFGSLPYLFPTDSMSSPFLSLSLASRYVLPSHQPLGHLERFRRSLVSCSLASPADKPPGRTGDDPTRMEDGHPFRRN